MKYAQEIGSDYVGEWFPNQQEAKLIQLDEWIEFPPSATYYDSTN